VERRFPKSWLERKLTIEAVNAREGQNLTIVQRKLRKSIMKEAKNHMRFDSKEYIYIYIYIYIYCLRPPLWSSGQSSWLQIRRPGFDSRNYQKKSSGSGTGPTQPREYN
jgi:hypothetical protein